MQYRKLTELKKLPNNPRIIRDKQFRTLCDSIRDNPEYFEARPVILSNRTGELIIIAGNMRYSAAKALKLKEVPTYLIEGLTEAKEREIIIRDNISNGEFDLDILANGWDDLPLLDWGLDLPADWLKEEETVGDAEPQIDKAEELNKVWQVNPGDLWQIGSHRLLCGDSTNAEDVGRVMGGEKADILFTDPPYGVDVVGSAGNIGGDTKNAKAGKYHAVIGDDKPFSPAHLFDLADSLIIWGANYFCLDLPSTGQWIVWDKNRPDGTTFSECELAWTNGKGIAIKKYKCTWDGFHREGESGARFHPTQKPVKLTQDILSDFGGDIVIDPYCGSGTTLIACENLKRRCFGIEISPDYVAVCLQRFEDAFGIKGVLVQDDELQRPLVHGKGGKG